MTMQFYVVHVNAFSEKIVGGYIMRGTVKISRHSFNYIVGER